MPFVTLEREGNIALITMNRPEALNALNRQVLEELNQVLDQVEADPEIYVAILTGAGRSFVAGADIGQMSTLTSAEAKAFGLFGNQVFLKLENLISGSTYIQVIAWPGGWDARDLFGYVDIHVISIEIS